MPISGGPWLPIFSVLCLPSSMEIYLASVSSSSCHEIKDWFYFEWAVHMCAVDDAFLGSEMISFLPNFLSICCIAHDPCCSLLPDHE